MVDIASLPIAVQNVANRGRTEMGEILDHDGRTPEHPCDRHKYFILAHYFYNLLISTLKGCNHSLGPETCAKGLSEKALPIARPISMNPGSTSLEGPINRYKNLYS